MSSDPILKAAMSIEPYIPHHAPSTGPIPAELMPRGATFQASWEELDELMGDDPIYQAIQWL